MFVPSTPSGSAASVSFALGSIPGRCGFLTLLFLPHVSRKGALSCSPTPNVPASEKKKAELGDLFYRLIKPFY